MHPEMRMLVDRMAAAVADRPPPGTLTPAEMRVQLAEDMASWNQDPPDLPRVENYQVPGPLGEVAVRVYYPDAGPQAMPALIYFHGGGWIVGDLDSSDHAIRTLVKQSKIAVASVDYCLAPEHPFPQPLEDCVSVSRWIRENGGVWGLDNRSLAIGGDSAGANLALATALDLRDQGENWLKFTLLIYGVYAGDLSTKSHRLFGNDDMGFGLQAMRRMWRHYIGDEPEAANCRAAPQNAELGGLPPALVIAAEMDPLRDDSRNLVQKMSDAGVQHEYREYPGVVHGFMGLTREFDLAVEAMGHAAEALRGALAQ